MCEYAILNGNTNYIIFTIIKSYFIIIVDQNAYKLAE